VTNVLKSALTALACFALAITDNLFATEIFHWVDANGVNHFSESPPPTDTNISNSQVRTLEIDGSQPASYDPNEDRYNVAAQAEAMQAIRDKLAEDRKNRQPEPPSPAENTIEFYPEQYGGNGILYPPGYRPMPPNWGQNRPPGRPPNRPGGKPDRPTPLPEEIPPRSRPFRPPG